MYRCKAVKTTNTRRDYHLKLFDFDFQKLNKSFVNVITHASFSEHLGSLYEELLELEIDYCSPITEIAVLVLGHDRDNLEVFLMTSMSTPEYGEQCHQLTDCIMATRANKGVALFKKMILLMDLYYTLAFEVKTNRTAVVMEYWLTQLLRKLEE